MTKATAPSKDEGLTSVAALDWGVFQRTLTLILCRHIVIEAGAVSYRWVAVYYLSGPVRDTPPISRNTLSR